VHKLSTTSHKLPNQVTDLVFREACPIIPTVQHSTIRVLGIIAILCMIYTMTVNLPIRTLFLLLINFFFNPPIVAFKYPLHTSSLHRTQSDTSTVVTSNPLTTLSGTATVPLDGGGHVAFSLIQLVVEEVNSLTSRQTSTGLLPARKDSVCDLAL
jgi:hypothetical protein